MSKSESLKPCPFCGSRSYAIKRDSSSLGHDGRGGWRLQCQRCFVSTDIYEEAQDAICAWNHRTGEATDAD